MTTSGRKTRIALIAGALAGLAATGMGSAADAADQLSFRRGSIGTNPAGTAFYVIGGAIAKTLTEETGAQIIVQPQAGSSVSVPLIESGEMTMCVISALDSGLHYRGDDGKPYPKLRTLAQLTPWPYGYMVLEKSGLKSISDLKGKRVVIEFKGNKSLELANRAMLAVAGLTDKEIQGVAVTGLPAGIKSVGEGAIDAAPVAAVGVPAVQELNASAPGGVRFLTLDGPNATTEFVSKQLAGTYVMPVNPAPNAPGVHPGTKVLGYDIFLVASADMKDDDAKAVVNTLLKKWEQIRKDYKQVAGTELKDLAKATNAVPYHSGAIAALKAAGLWQAANDVQEKKLAAKN